MERKLSLLLVYLVLTELVFSFTIFDPLYEVNTHFWNIENHSDKIQVNYMGNQLKINGSLVDVSEYNFGDIFSELKMDYTQDINASVWINVTDHISSLQGENLTISGIRLGQTERDHLFHCAIAQAPAFGGNLFLIQNSSFDTDAAIMTGGLSGTINLFYNATSQNATCYFYGDDSSFYQVSMIVNDIDSDLNYSTLLAGAFSAGEGASAATGDVEAYFNDFEITFNGTDDCHFITGGAWALNDTIICENRTIDSYYPILVLDQSDLATTEFNTTVSAAFNLIGNSSNIGYQSMVLNPSMPSKYTNDWDPDANAVFKIVMNESRHAIQIYSNFTSSTKIYSINLDNDIYTGGADGPFMTGSDFIFGYHSGAGNALLACFNSSEDDFDIFFPTSGVFGSTICGAEVDPSYERTFNVSWNFSDSPDYQFVILINTTGDWVDKPMGVYDTGFKYTKFKNGPLLPENVGKGNFTLRNMTLNVFNIFDVNGNLNVYDSLLNFSLDTNGSSNFTWVPGSVIKINNSVITGNSTLYQFGLDISSSEFYINYSNFSGMGVFGSGDNFFSGKGELIGNTFNRSATWLVIGLVSNDYIRAISNSVLQGTTNDLLFASDSDGMTSNYNISNNIIAGWLGGANARDSVLYNNTASTLYVDGSSGGNASLGPLINVTLWNNAVTGYILDANNTNYNQLKYSNEYGEIYWNITNISVGTSLALGNKITIADNLIGVDLESYSSQLSNLNQTAEITFYGLPWSSGIQLCANNSGLLENCYGCTAGNNCTYSSGVLIANVSHFSNYSTNGSDFSGPSLDAVNVTPLLPTTDDNLTATAINLSNGTGATWAYPVYNWYLNSTGTGGEFQSLTVFNLVFYTNDTSEVPIFDASDHGFNGYVVGSMPLSQSYELPGLIVNSSGGMERYVSMANGSNLNLTDFSEFTMSIAFDVDNDFSPSDYSAVAMRANDPSWFVIALTSDGYLLFSWTNSTNEDVTLSTTSPIDYTQPNVFDFVYNDSGEIKLYVNGALNNSIPANDSTKPYSDSGNFSVGSFDNGDPSANPFNGTIIFFRMYDVSLWDSELAFLMDDPVSWSRIPSTLLSDGDQWEAIGQVFNNLGQGSVGGAISNIVTVTASQTIRVVNTTSPACTEGTYNYETIQGAVDESSSGDLIIVCNDDPIRQEEVDLHVAGITVAGNETGTIINAVGPNRNIFNITRANVTIANFTIAGSSYSGGDAGFGISVRAVNSTILNNNFTNNVLGISLFGGSNNTQIIGNNFVGTILPITSWGGVSYNLNFTSNTLFGTGSVIFPGAGDVSRGFDITGFYRTTISNNTIYNFTYGIYSTSYDNTLNNSITNITGPNLIFNNTYGLLLNGTNLTITGNLIENNTLLQPAYPNTVAIHLGPGSRNITYSANNFSGNQIIFNITNTSSFRPYDYSYLDNYGFAIGADGGLYFNKTSSPGTAPSGYTSVNRYFNVTNYTDAIFSLYVTYTLEELGSIDETTLKLFRTIDGVTWTEVTTVVDTGGHGVASEDITEFGIFGLFGREITYLDDFYDDFAGTEINTSRYEIVSDGVDVSQDDGIIVNGSGVDVFGGVYTIGLVNTSRSFVISTNVNLTNLTEISGSDVIESFFAVSQLEGADFAGCSVGRNSTGYYLRLAGTSNQIEVSTGTGPLFLSYDSDSNEVSCNFDWQTIRSQNQSTPLAEYQLFILGGGQNTEFNITFDDLNFSYIEPGYCGNRYYGGDWSITSTVICRNEVIPVNGSLTLTSTDLSSHHYFDNNNFVLNSSYAGNVSAEIPPLVGYNESYTENWDFNNSFEFRIMRDENNNTIKMFVNRSESVYDVSRFYMVDFDNNASTGLNNFGDGHGYDFYIGNLSEYSLHGTYCMLNNVDFVQLANGDNCSNIYTAYFSYGEPNAYEVVLNGSNPWVSKPVIVSDANSLFVNTVFHNYSAIGNLSLENVTLIIGLTSNGSANITVNSGAIFYANNSNITSNDTSYLYNWFVTGGDINFTLTNSNISYAGDKDSGGVHGSVGIKFYRTSNGIVIRNNTISDSFGSSIVLSQASYAVIDGNNLQNGMMISGDAPGRFSEYNNITNNHLQTRSIGFSDGCRNNFIAGNLIGTLVTSSYSENASGNNFTNNSIYSITFNTSASSYNYIQYQNQYGSVLWNLSNISFGNNYYVDWQMSLSINPNISSNLISFAPDPVYHTNYNTSAQLEFYGLTGWGSNDPIILKNDVACSSPQCNVTFWDNSSGTLVVEVAGFSNYSAQDGGAPSLAIFFVDPTSENNTNTTNTSVEINVSILGVQDLGNFTFNWNGTNYTLYNDSIVLMYNFDNVSALGENDSNVTDVSIYENNGYCDLESGYCPIWASDGKYNGAYEFDGVDDYINLTDTDSLNPHYDSFSITSWVKTNVTTHSRIFSKGSHGFSEGYALLMYGPESGGSGTASIVFTPLPDIDEYRIDSDAPIGDGQWKFLVGVFNRSGNMELYINGVKQSATYDISSFAADDVIGENAACVGASCSVGHDPITSEFFNGSIDEVRIYNRSLSAEEIQQLYYSNLNKYDTDKWSFYANESNLSMQTYVYQAFVSDLMENTNQTDERYLNRVPAVRIVNGSGESCQVGDAYYETIQSAIDASENGDTLIVCDNGTAGYNETVTIDKSISIFGNESGVLVTGSTGSNLFTVNANNVVVSNFSFQLDGTGIAVVIIGSNVTITDNTMFNLTWGVNADSNSHNNYIANNRFNYSNIYAADHNTTYHNNSIFECTGGCTGYYLSGSENNFTNNSISGASYTNCFYVNNDANANLIANNTIQECTNFGIYVQANSNNTIVSNIIENGAGGIYLQSAYNTSIYQNIIRNNTYGVQFGEAAAVTSNLFNNFFNNTQNVLFSVVEYANTWNTTRQSGTRVFSSGLEIGGNYWADPSGTGYSETCTDADVDGFCDDSYEITTNNFDELPLSPLFLDLRVVNNSEPCAVAQDPSYYYSTIQSAIDAITDGGAIIVCNDSTYFESIAISKPLSLYGNESGVVIVGEPGITIENTNNVNIANFEFSGPYVGSAIYALNSDYLYIENITTDVGDLPGQFYFNNVDYSTIANSNLITNAYYLKFDNSNWNTVINCNLSSLGGASSGIQLSTSNNNTIMNSSVYGANYGLYVSVSSNNNISNLHVYGNTQDVFITDMGAHDILVSNVTLDNPSGTFENFTSLSFYYLTSGMETISISWINNSNALPTDRVSFAQKFVNISSGGGSPTIEQINWSWTDDEASGYNENVFELWKYNSSGWTLLNDTPDTTNNVLSLSDLHPSSIYAVLQDASPLVVNATSPACIEGRAYYSTISDAITAAVNGDTIIVCNDSTYTEQLTINKEINLYGNESGSELGYVGNPSVLVTANNVNISNFTVVGPGTGAGSSGIAIQTANNTIIDNVLIHDHAYGVVTNSDVSATTVSNSIIHTSTYSVYATSSSITLNNNTIFDSSLYGAIFGASPTENITAINNRIYGIANSVFYSTNLINNATIVNNTIYDSGYAVYTYLSNSTIANNTINKISSVGLFLIDSSDLDISGNNFSNISSYAVYASFSSNPSSRWGIDGNHFYNISSIAINLDNTHYSHINITNNYIELVPSTYSFNLANVNNFTVLNNTIINSNGGIALNSCSDTTVENNTVSGSISDLIYVTTSSNINITGNNLSSSGAYGINLNSVSDSVFVRNNHYHNNTVDFYVHDSTFTLQMLNDSFDNPLGSYENYSSISLVDSTSGEYYYVNWSTNSSDLPSSRIPFANKFINFTVTSGSPTIDAINFSWMDSELSGYNESNFELWRYDTSWARLNLTPDTVNNVLSLNNLALSGTATFAILENTAEPLSVTIYLPENTTYTTLPFTLNYTVTGQDQCWYSNDSGETNTTLENCENITLPEYLNGGHTITVYVNDTFNSILSDEVSFTLDIKRTRIVNTTDTCRIGDAYYSTIQSAIDASQLGDTIIVCNDSTYTEAITINKEVNLYGNESGVVVTSGNPILYILPTNNVNVSNFTLVGSGVEQGIRIDSLNNNTYIHDLLIYNTQYSIYLLSSNIILQNNIIHSSQYGIFSDATDVPFSNVLILNNTVYGMANEAVFLRNHFNFSIINNTFHSGLNSGLREMYTANDTVTGNIFYNLSGNPALYFDYASRVNVSDNILFHNSIGPDIRGGFYNNSVISNNFMYNSSGGIGDTIENTTVTGNRLSNCSNGFYFNGASDSNISNNSLHYASGFTVMSGSIVNIENNSAFDSPYGFSINTCNYCNYTNNTFYNNTAGFKLSANSEYAVFSGNLLYNNSNGFEIMGVGSKSYLLFVNNLVYNNNDGFNTTTNGLSYSVFENNSVFNNTNNGFYVYGSQGYNNFTNNSVHNNYVGFNVTDNSRYNLLANNSIFENAYGISETSYSDINQYSSNHLYNNSIVDFLIFGNIFATPTYSFSNMTFDNPLGSIENKTMLDILDLIVSTDSYSINWSGSPGGLPFRKASFAQKFVNISALSGTPIIDSINWTWTDGEVSGHDENMFGLWKYDGVSWSMLDATLDTSNNVLSVTNLVPASIYAILENQTYVATLVVNGTGESCQVGDAYYSTIQSAIDASQTGDTIIVCTKDGGYTENVNINKQINLYGNESEVLVTSATTSTVFTVSTNNVNISNFTLTGATGGGSSGIDFSSASNGLIRYVNSSGNSYGFILSSSSGITFSNNTVYGILQNAFSFFSSPSNTVNNNSIHDCSSYGLYIDSSSPYNLVSNNTIYSNMQAMRINGATGTVVYNNFFNNSNNLYVDTADPNDLNITRQPGIRIFSSGLEIGGNYWATPTGDGYSETCTDANVDGFCDDPYTLGVNNVDYLPLTIIPAPVISIYLPANDTYNSLSTDLNFTILGDPSFCWYSLNSGVTNTSLPSCANTTITAAEGGNTVFVYANNSYGLVGSSSVSFTVDTVAPYLTVQSPENRTYNTSTIELNFTTYDVTTAVDSCWYSNDSGATNATLESCNNISIEGYLDGAHTITVYANDSVGNLNSSSRSFTVDTTIPIVNISSPENTSYASSSIRLNYTAYDSTTSISTCWYSNDSGVTNATLPSCANRTITGYSDGVHTITVYVNDSANNRNSSNVSFTIDTVAPYLTIELPENTTYNTSNITLNYTVYDVATAVDTCWYSNDSGATNATLESCNNISIVGYLDGSHTIIVYANDSVGNLNSTSRSFTIDITPPWANNVSNATILANQSGTINWILYDNIDEGYYYVERNGTVQNSSTAWTNGTLIPVWVNTTASGIWNYTIHFNDSIGNPSNSTVMILIPQYTYIGNASDATSSGISNLNVSYNDSSNGSSTNLSLLFADGSTQLFNFSHDFDSSALNFSQINIQKSSTYLIVNLSDQLLPGETKTLFLADTGFVKLCAKDDDVLSSSELSSTCTGTNETDFTTCLGNPSGTTLNGMTCYDEGSIIRIEGMNHSAIWGVTPTSSSTSTSSDTQKKKLIISKYFNCQDGTLEVNLSYSSTPVSDVQIYLFGKGNLGFTSSTKTTNGSGTVRFQVEQNGTYEIETAATGKYYKETTGQFQLALCSVPTEQPLENITSNETTVEQNETELPQNETNLEMFDAQSVIDDAESQILTAEKDGKDVSEAIDKLEQAKSAFDLGNYADAKSFAFDSIKLIKSAKETGIPKDVEPSDSQPKSADNIIWIIIGGLAVVGILTVLFLKFRGRK